MGKATITDLIIDFQRTARTVAEVFYQAYYRTDLLRAYHDGTIPKEGKNFGVLSSYSFHGAGLFARLNKVEVDFDFGPNDRVDGFDAWRLVHFAESKKADYEGYLNGSAIQSELDELEKKGEIIKLGEYPGTSNYYWKEQQVLTRHTGIQDKHRLSPCSPYVRVP